MDRPGFPADRSVAVADRSVAVAGREVAVADRCVAVAEWWPWRDGKRTGPGRAARRGHRSRVVRLRGGAEVRRPPPGRGGLVALRDVGFAIGTHGGDGVRCCPSTPVGPTAHRRRGGRASSHDGSPHRPPPGRPLRGDRGRCLSGGPLHRTGGSHVARRWSRRAPHRSAVGRPDDPGRHRRVAPSEAARSSRPSRTDHEAEIRVVVTSRLTLGLALLLAGAFLLVVARRRRERDGAAALAALVSRNQPSSPIADPDSPRWRSRGGWAHLAGRPRARAPTPEEVAASMVLMAVALQSGCGVVEGIEHVAHVAPPVPAAELGVVAAALRWGLDEEWAWAEVNPRWSRAALAMRLAREAGVAPSSLLLSGADDLRSNRLADDRRCGRPARRPARRPPGGSLPARLRPDDDRAGRPRPRSSGAGVVSRGPPRLDGA